MISSGLKLILHAILLTVVILKPVTVSAETVAIPVFLNYPQLQLLMKRAMFTGPDYSAQYLLDDDGCNTISFSEPHLSVKYCNWNKGVRHGMLF